MREFRYELASILCSIDSREVLCTHPHRELDLSALRCSWIEIFVGNMALHVGELRLSALWMGDPPYFLLLVCSKF